MEPFLSMIHMGEEREKTLPDPGFGAFCLPSNTAVSTPRGPGSSRCKPVEADKPPSSDDVAGSGIDADSTMHYGEEKSRNDFADEPAGYVYGCMDPGDEIMFDTLADLGQDATPAPAENGDGEEYRAPGRDSDRPDADTAAAVLASVRENHVAPAAGRYARDADDPDSGAVVYVDTNAVPEEFVDVEAPGVEWLPTDL